MFQDMSGAWNRSCSLRRTPCTAFAGQRCSRAASSMSMRPTEPSSSPAPTLKMPTTVNLFMRGNMPAGVTATSGAM